VLTATASPGLRRVDKEGEVKGSATHIKAAVNTRQVEADVGPQIEALLHSVCTFIQDMFSID